MHEVGELGRGQETEFAGSLARVEEQTKIGGGNAGGFEEAFFLDVVGDEVVVARAAELMKVAPDPEGMFAQEEVVFVMQLLAWLAGRAVEPSAYVALEAPQDQDGRGGHQGDGMGEAHDGSEEDGDNRRERRGSGRPGRAALGCDSASAAVSHSSRRFPVIMRRTLSAHDGVDGQQGLVGQKREGEEG